MGMVWSKLGKDHGKTNSFFSPNSLRLCLIRVKAFPKIFYFPERKMFSCVWLHFKKFSEKYFLVFGEEEGKDKPDKPRRRRRRRDLDLREIAIDGERTRWTIAPLVDRAAHRSIVPLVDRRVHSSDDRTARRSMLSNLGSLFSLSLSPIWALSSLSLSLSLSLFFQKWFEVKMRV